MNHAKVVTSRRYDLGECLRWDPDAGELSWVDLHRGRLLRARPGEPGGLDDPRELRVDRPLGAVAPARAGGWVVAAGRGIAHLAPDGALTDLVPDLEPPSVRMNDGVCDPQGRFWAGSMAHDAEPGAGRLHRLGHDGGVTTVLRGLTISNGLGWSPDGAIMYVTDSGARSITAYRFDAFTGDISDPRPFLRLQEGEPDGLAVDSQGWIWVAAWDAAEVLHVDPSGAIRHRVPLPAARPTSCALVGTTLFVTSARCGGPANRDDGAIMAVEVAVGGPGVVAYGRRT